MEGVLHLHFAGCPCHLAAAVVVVVVVAAVHVGGVAAAPVGPAASSAAAAAAVGLFAASPRCVSEAAAQASDVRHPPLTSTWDWASTSRIPLSA